MFVVCKHFVFIGYRLLLKNSFVFHYNGNGGEFGDSPPSLKMNRKGRKTTHSTTSDKHC